MHFFLHLRILEIVVPIVSVTLFVAGLIAIPWLIRRLPSDYFVHPPKPKSAARRVLRNVLGVLLIAAGVAMLILPGPGVVAIVLGLTVVDLPIKQRALAALFKREKIQEGIQRLRSKAGKPPFAIPQSA